MTRLINKHNNNRLLFLLLTSSCLWVSSLVSGQSTTTTTSSCQGPRTPGELKASLLEGYDKYARPSVAAAIANGTSATTQIAPDVARVQLHILSLNNVDQKSNEYELSVWFRRSWIDPRLQFLTTSQDGCFSDRLGFPESLLEEIWQPDYYIENEAKTATRLAGSMWIYPDGEVVWSQQLELSLACHMEFSDFPHDIQKCGVRIGTFQEDASSVTLQFMNGLDPVTLATDSADGESDTLPRGGTTEWSILHAKGIDSTAQGGALSKESTVEIQLELARNSAYYQDFVIIPTIMFVIIAWCSFFIDRSAAPARVAMSMICFLANTNFLSGQLGQLPRLGNNVWLLRFMSMSSWFTFYAIVEYVACNYLRRIEARIDGARKKTRENTPHPQHASNKQKNDVEEAAPVTDPSIRVSAAASTNKHALINAGLDGKMDLLLTKQNGQMWIKDERLEIFSRYAYPIVYIAASLGMYYTQY